MPASSSHRSAYGEVNSNRARNESGEVAWPGRLSGKDDKMGRQV
jgi:hypothetical protein